MLKKLIAAAIVISLAGGSYAPVYADDVQTDNMEAAEEKAVYETAGVLPDSPFYGLELSLEQLKIEITRSQEKLASIKAELAVERAAEAIVMADEEKAELVEKVTKEYIGLLASSAEHINKAIEAKDEAVETMKALNEAYSESGQLLEDLLNKAPDESKEAIQNALNEQDEAISAVNNFYAAKGAFFEAKEQLKKAKRELQIAKKGGSAETIQIAEEKVLEAKALKDELEALKDAAEMAKEEVENLSEQAEKSIEKGLKNVEKVNEKLDKAEEKAYEKAQKLEEKRLEKINKQIEKDKKEEEKSKEEIKKVKVKED